MKLQRIVILVVILVAMSTVANAQTNTCTCPAYPDPVVKRHTYRVVDTPRVIENNVTVNNNIQGCNCPIPTTTTPTTTADNDNRGNNFDPNRNTDESSAKPATTATTISFDVLGGGFLGFMALCLLVTMAIIVLACIVSMFRRH